MLTWSNIYASYFQRGDTDSKAYARNALEQEARAYSLDVTKNLEHTLDYLLFYKKQRNSIFFNTTEVQSTMLGLLFGRRSYKTPPLKVWINALPWNSTVKDA